MDAQQTHLYDEAASLLRDYLDAFKVNPDTQRDARRALLCVAQFLLHPMTYPEADAALFAAKLAVLTERIR